ncbi:MAG: DUF4397 domain-containing protein [Chitinophagaceae bacterium]|nr:DUF4397 domain-containing protein [Chitinophagaceae bacterium]
MKKLLYALIYANMMLSAISCKKDNITPPQLATFVLINAVNNGDPVKADFTGKEDVFATTQLETATDQYQRFAIPAGQNVPVRITSSANSGKFLFNQSFTFTPGDIYSLFLLGDQESVDTLLVKEDISVIYDTAMGIRFINYSPSGPLKIVPVFVDSYGVSSEQAPIATLGYKEKTAFISYPAPSSLFYYLFEFRDPVTDNLLASTFLEWNTHHTTFVIKGFANGSPQLSAFRVSYDMY